MLGFNELGDIITGVADARPLIVHRNQDSRACVQLFPTPDVWLISSRLRRRDITDVPSSLV